MAASTATSGFGVTIGPGDGASPEVFTPVAEVTGTLEGPTMSADAIETTHHTSPNGWREFIGGLKDGGEVTFEVNWIPGHATQDESTGLVSKVGVKGNWQIAFPDAASTTCTFAAILTNFEPATPLDDKMMGSVTIKVSGEYTWA